MKLSVLYSLQYRRPKSAKHLCMYKKILRATPKSSWLRPDWFKRAENIPICLILISLFWEMVPTLCVIFKCLIPVPHEFAVTAGSAKCDLCWDQWEFCYWIQCSHDSPDIAGVYLLLISLLQHSPISHTYWTWVFTGICHLWTSFAFSRKPQCKH